MRKDLDIALLRAFLAVVELGGVTRAAAALGVSQAAASQQIKRLEEALECRLFERTGTAAGAGAGRRAAVGAGAPAARAQRRSLVVDAHAVVRRRGPPGRALRHHRGLRAAHPAPLRQGAAAGARQPGLRRFKSGARAAEVGRRRSRAHHRDRMRPPRRDLAHRPAGVGRRAGRRCASQGPAAGFARRADLRVPAGGDRGAGQGAARLARGLRGEPARAGACRDRGGPRGGAPAALLGAGAVRDPGPPPARHACRRCPSSRSTSMRRLVPARPRAISPSMSARALPGAPTRRTTIDTIRRWSCPTL